MNSVWLLVIGITIFIVAYICYGGYLAKKWGIDPNRPTPAHTKCDNMDYVPTNPNVLFGHHFASIAGAGPIAGPIQASIFGWLPVYLWILCGSIFIGGVHDFGSLFASVRHGGSSIGEVINKNIGKKGKELFNIFAWLTLVLVVASFTSITAGSFEASPQAATASMIFILLAILFGFIVYRRNASLPISTIVGVACVFFAIYIGYRWPVLKFSKETWYVILLVYIYLASVLPVWILLQPRDYLNSFILYAMVIGGILGIIITRPALEMSSTTGFAINTDAGTQYLFPMLFVTVACGAVSGFHSLVSSGTTSKQLDNENNIKRIGYGAMLTEGVVAIIALISVAAVGKVEGTPAVAFATGLSKFMAGFGLPEDVGFVFTTLAFTAFALTSLDTSARIGRYIWQESFESHEKTKGTILTNMHFATAITVICSAILLGFGYEKIWPIFGTANQLLAALALLAVTVWLTKTNRKSTMTKIPMIFMFCVTLCASVLLIFNSFGSGKVVLGVLAAVLFVLAIALIREGVRALKGTKQQKSDIKA